MHETVALRFAAGGALMLLSAVNAVALEEPKGEKVALKACERRLCDLVVGQSHEPGGDFTCALSKTWAKTELKQGSSVGRLSWGFGDARCSVDLSLARAAIISAVKDPKATIQFPEHTVTCLIEGEKEPTNVTATLAPKAEFEGGRAKKIWVNLKRVEGSSVIGGLAVTAAKLQDSVGIFHKPLIKALNRMIHEKCPKVAAGG